MADAATPSGSTIEADALVIGAGPVGLFQVFQLGLLDIKAHLVDSLPYVGGQCIELYPDKPIYDIPGTPHCTGRELVASLLKQLTPFTPPFHLEQEVSVVEKQPDGRFHVETSRGTHFLAKTIFLASGVGAFQPKKLRVEGLDRFEGSQLLYRVGNTSDFAGKDVLVVGGDDTALGWAMRLATLDADQPKSVTLLHRRDVFQADADMVLMINALCEGGALQFKVGQVTGHEESGGQLTAALVTDVDGNIAPLPADTLLVMQGLSPKLGPVADWGLDMERKQVKVDTAAFATSIPGIFAVGDINTYPGKKKLILSGFHESALAAFGAAEIVFPDKETLLQYTTTSPRLHKLLGVAPDTPPA
ncbi:MAG: NAD(P)/FAD-dependent oxidoreductase [Pseudomonadota bacterium]